MKLPLIIQNHPGENPAAALAMILAYNKKYVPMQEMLEICVPNRSGIMPSELSGCAETFGLKTRVERIPAEQLSDGDCPFAVLWKKKYYVIVTKIKNGKVKVADPAKGEYTITAQKFAQTYSGTALFMRPGPDFVPGGKKVTLWKLLRKRFAGYKEPVLVTLGLNLAVTVINLRMLSITQTVLDNFLDAPGIGDYGYYLAAMSILLVAVTLASVFDLLTLNNTSRKMAAASGSGLFKHLLRLPLNFFEQHSAGELMERVERNIQLDHSLLQRFFPRIVDCAMMTMYLVMMFAYESTLAAVCVAIEILYIIASTAVQQKKSLVMKSLTASSGAMNASLLNGLGMIETIKTTGSERHFFKSWHESQNSFDKNCHITQRLDIISSIVSSAHSVITSGFLLVAGAYFIINGRFTLGMLSVFQSIIGSARSALSNCISTINSIQSMRVAMDRVEDIVSRSVRPEVFLEKDAEPDKLRGAVRLENVSYKYSKSDAYAVNDVSFEVKPGQMVALVGATGCGKSTILKLIADMYDVSDGRIYYDGKKRENIPDVVFRSSVVSVDQEPVVFEDSIGNNLKMWDDTVEDFEIILAARDAQIHKRILLEPQKYNSEIKENGRNFSGGELQRLELARALAQEPTLLLLDEFTSALDARTEERVFSAIRDKGTTCVIVAHRLSTIVECDHIIVLSKGRIVQQGTHAELSQVEGLYKNLICTQ